ncbi:hypothetical protein [Anaerocolumna sedimenticola]|uniref:hypothetical protein n=1 Tax=Anaerocolumna sedimenticola TaxID=2696063 RepID=UPI00192A4C88|nr:hypothetical protein [Anaerocolumna sedimenticola]
MKGGIKWRYRQLKKAGKKFFFPFQEKFYQGPVFISDDSSGNRTADIISLPANGGLIIAFKDYSFKKGILGSSWAGLENFKFIFNNSDFYTVVKIHLGLIS